MYKSSNKINLNKHPNRVEQAESQTSKSFLKSASKEVEDSEVNDMTPTDGMMLTYRYRPALKANDKFWAILNVTWFHRQAVYWTISHIRQNCMRSVLSSTKKHCSTIATSSRGIKIYEIITNDCRTVPKSNTRYSPNLGFVELILTTVAMITMTGRTHIQKFVRCRPRAIWNSMQRDSSESLSTGERSWTSPFNKNYVAESFIRIRRKSHLIFRIL